MVKDKKASEFATRDYTIHLSKRLYGVTFKKRAPRAVREVKKFAQQMMKTRCVFVERMSAVCGVWWCGMGSRARICCCPTTMYDGYASARHRGGVGGGMMGRYPPCCVALQMTAELPDTVLVLLETTQDRLLYTGAT